MAQPQLSIIVVTYNSRAVIGDCLRSLDRACQSRRFETIVVDNCSTDGTPDYVKEVDPTALIRKSETNAGFAAATNAGVRESVGETVLLLNPDTILPALAIDRLCEVLDVESGIGAIGPKLVTRDGRLDHACKRGLPTPASAFWYFTGVARLFPTHPRFARYTAGHIHANQAADVESLSGAFMLMPRMAFESVDGMDERYWLYTEDIDLCVRLRGAGWRIRYEPSVCVVHLKGGVSTRLRTGRANREFHRGMALFYDQHLSRNRPRTEQLAVRAGIAVLYGLSETRSALQRRRLALRGPGRDQS